MNVASMEDVNYLAQQSSGRINMILSEMTALMHDTDNKVASMESENWFQRMVKTITGKNKLTQSEIQQNHNKINAYMSEIIAELYNRNCIDYKIMISLGAQMNELYADHIQLKQILGTFVKKLNEKIDSIDNFHLLIEEINLGFYGSYSPLAAVCKIMSQFDNRILNDNRKLDILKKSLLEHDIVNDNQIKLIEYLKNVVDIPMEDAGQIYLELGTIRGNYMANIILRMMENYHFLSDMARKMKKKDVIISNIIGEEGLDMSIELSMNDIYDDFINSKIDVKRDMDVMPDDLSSREKKEVYDLNTIEDIVDLEEIEKHILIAVLYQISSEDETELTEEQKEYIRTVQKYIGIKNPQVQYDLNAIGDIENLSVQKAILQTVLEFFYLGSSYSQKQIDVLEYFNVSKKTINEIISHIETIVNTVGRIGLIEKYGFSADEEKEIENEGYDDIEQIKCEDLEEIFLTGLPNNLSGDKKISYKIIHCNMRDNIYYEGNCELENCVIHYNEDGNNNVGFWLMEGTVVFRNCLFICHGKATDKTLYFITIHREVTMLFEKCTFESCTDFLGTTWGSLRVIMTKCNIVDCYGNFIKILSHDDMGSKSEISGCLFTTSANCVFPNFRMRYNEGIIYADSMDITNCKIIGHSDLNNEMNNINEQVYFEVRDSHVKNCSFINVANCLRYVKSLENCIFTGCKNVIRSDGETKRIDNCCFQDCTDNIINMEGEGRIINCQFVQCHNQLINWNVGKTYEEEEKIIDNCEFINISSVPMSFGCIYLNDINDARIVGCTFDGINLEGCYLINASINDWYRRGTSVNQIENCKFLNCVTYRMDQKIIEEEYSYYSGVGIFRKEKSYRTVEIINCVGLDEVNQGNSKVEKYKIKTKSTMNQIIGAELEGKTGSSICFSVKKEL